MIYFIDTEFIERGHEYPIELISLGIVREDGETVYRVLADGWDPNHASQWVVENVFPNLGVSLVGGEPPVYEARWFVWAKAVKQPPWATRAALADELREWIGPDQRPIFVGYFCDYDWVLFCQLFGTMMDLPENFPKFCRDIKQTLVERGNPDMRVFVPQLGRAHNALDDAMRIRAMHMWLEETMAAT